MPFHILDVSFWRVPNQWITIVVTFSFNIISPFWRHIFTCNVPVTNEKKKKKKRGRLFLLQRKFSSIHTITKSLTSAKTRSSELLAAELRTLYIQDNWGCCKYSAAQWRCTYTFPKWLYIIRLSAQQKRVSFFFSFFFLLSVYAMWQDASWNVSWLYDLRPCVFSVVSAVLFMFSTGSL